MLMNSGCGCAALCTEWAHLSSGWTRALISEEESKVPRQPGSPAVLKCLRKGCPWHPPSLTLFLTGLGSFGHDRANVWGSSPHPVRSSQWLWRPWDYTSQFEMTEARWLGWRGSWVGACLANVTPKIHLKLCVVCTGGSGDRWIPWVS